MNLTNKLGVIFALVFLGMSSVVQASSYFCKGKVDRLSIRANDGGVSVISAEMFGHTSSGGIDICSVNQERNGISVQVCFAWYSLLQKAKEAGTRVGIQYLNDGKTCLTQETWTRGPAPWAIFDEPEV